PLAPGLLSTITGWPSDFDISGPIMRATVSRIPPGATGTTSVTGCVGKAGACANVVKETKAAAASAQRAMAGMRAVFMARKCHATRPGATGWRSVRLILGERHLAEACGGDPLLDWPTFFATSDQRSPL